MKDTVQNKVLETIKKKRMRPASELVIALKNITVWFIWTLILIFTALLFSKLLFVLSNNGVEDLHYITGSKAVFLWVSLPLTTVVLISIFAYLAYLQFKHTEGGYKIPWVRITFINILLIVSIGVGFFITGIGYTAEYYLAKFKREEVHMKLFKAWNNPKEGRLAGELLPVDQDTLSLLSIDNKTYVIDISGVSETQIPINTPVRVIGKELEDATFYACHILSARMRGRSPVEIATYQRINEIQDKDMRSSICRDVSATY